MPFKRVFERRVNEAMQQGEAGRAPADREEGDEADTKKQHDTKEPELEEFEEEDQEFSGKKDRPPRFSTLFQEATKAPAQVPDIYVEPRKRRSGVFIPTPLLVVLALILLFESTILFAYTVIGLYNNLPSTLLAVGGPAPAPIDGCNCAVSTQGAINISPNFFMPGAQVQAQPGVSLSVTGTILSDALSTPTPSTATSIHTSTSSSTTSSSSSTASPSTNTAAAAASNLLSMFAGLKPSTTTSHPNIAISTKLVTATPTQSTITSTYLSTATPPGPPTVTSVKVVHASSSSSADATAKRRSLQSGISEAVDGDSTVQASSSSSSSATTLQTLASPSPPFPPATTEGEGGSLTSPTEVSGSSSATGMPCFGGSGAVALNCPDGV